MKKLKVKNILFSVLIIVTVAIFLTSCQQDSLINTDVVPSEENSELILKSAKDLNMITLNTQLLDSPDIFNGPQCDGQVCEERALSCCDYVTGQAIQYDVIALQEAFDNTARGHLVNCIESQGYICYESDNGQFLEEGAGLVTCFRLQTIDQNSIYGGLYEFDECSNASGSDCLSQKGFMVHSFKPKNGCYIYLVNTHMDAGEEWKDRYVRRLQAAQINSVIKNVNTSVIITGDLNIIGVLNPEPSNEFGRIMDIWDGEAHFQIANQPPSPTAGQNTSSGFTKTLDHFILINRYASNIRNVVYDDLGFDCRNSYYKVNYWGTAYVWGYPITVLKSSYPYRNHASALAFAATQDNAGVETVSAPRCGDFLDVPRPRTDHLPTAIGFRVCN